MTLSKSRHYTVLISELMSVCVGGCRVLLGCTFDLLVVAALNVLAGAGVLLSVGQPS
jgi:hypothetical protein